MVIAKEVRLTEGDVEWCGQTITDGGEGKILWGRSNDGALHIRIVCDRPTGVTTNEAILPNGLEMIHWLLRWFDPAPTYVVNAQ